MITLPKTVQPALRKSPKRLIIYGPPKVGKTTTVCKLPNSLLIDCENGSDYVEAVKIKANTLGELYNILEAIHQEKNPYKYVIIDTIDTVEDWCIQRGTILYKMSPQGKNFTGNNVLVLPNGAGYLWLRIAFHEVLDKIVKVAPNIILIGHIRDKMLEEAGKEVQAKDLDLTGKLKSIICSWADAIGLMERTKTEELTITFKTSSLVQCGSRSEHLKGKTIKMTKPEDWNQIYVD